MFLSPHVALLAKSFGHPCPNTWSEALKTGFSFGLRIAPILRLYLIMFSHFALNLFSSVVSQNNGNEKKINAKLENLIKQD